MCVLCASVKIIKNKLEMKKNQLRNVHKLAPFQKIPYAWNLHVAVTDWRGRGRGRGESDHFLKVSFSLCARGIKAFNQFKGVGGGQILTTSWTNKWMFSQLVFCYAIFKELLPMCYAGDYWFSLCPKNGIHKTPASKAEQRHNRARHNRALL